MTEVRFFIVLPLLNRKVAQIWALLAQRHLRNGKLGLEKQNMSEGIIFQKWEELVVQPPILVDSLRCIDPPQKLVFLRSTKYAIIADMVGLAQMVRASDCGPEGRRFDPDIPPPFLYLLE